MSTQDAIHETVHAAAVPSLPQLDVGLRAGLPIERLYRFTVDQYHRMGESGILRESEPVELIEGFIVAMSPKSVAHRYAVDALLAILPTMLAQEWYASGQNPMRLGGSEPEPDVAILRGSYRDYHDRHPRSEDAGLVIEMAESSLDYDRRTKEFLYSQHHVPEYWIVNLLDDCIEVYRPAPGTADHFIAAESFDIGTEVPMLLAGRNYGSVRVAELFAGGDRESHS
jgi:Uma2 family endonuclease